MSVIIEPYHSMFLPSVAVIVARGLVPRRPEAGDKPLRYTLLCMGSGERTVYAA